MYVRIRGTVLGPFDAEKLQSMVRRGQLSRFHEVSPDGASWERASKYPELFARPPAAAPAAAPAAEPANPQAAPPTVVAGEAPTALAKPWYYEKGGKTVGPVDEGVFHQLLSAGVVSENTMVWNDQLPAWMPVSAVSELAHRRQPPTVTTQGEAAADDDLPESLCKVAADSRPWVGFLAVMAYIYAGLSLLGGIFLMIQGGRAQDPVAVASGMSSLVNCGVFGAAGYLLSSFGAHCGSLRHARSGAVLERALEVLRSFWMFASIVLIVLLAFVLFVVIWAVAVGSTFPGF